MEKDRRLIRLLSIFVARLKSYTKNRLTHEESCNIISKSVIVNKCCSKSPGTSFQL